MQRKRLPRVVGLTGLAGSGKSTCAKILCEDYGYTERSFATPIKEMISCLLGQPKSLWTIRAWKEAPLLGIEKSPRELAQTLGTEWGRELVNEDLWVQMLQKRLKPRKRYVISDVRFMNELEFIHKLGGIVLFVCREPLMKVPAHISERSILSLKSRSILIDNQGSIDATKIALSQAIG